MGWQWDRPQVEWNSVVECSVKMTKWCTAWLRKQTLRHDNSRVVLGESAGRSVADGRRNRLMMAWNRCRGGGQHRWHCKQTIVRTHSLNDPPLVIGLTELALHYCCAVFVFGVGSHSAQPGPRCFPPVFCASCLIWCTTTLCSHPRHEHPVRPHHSSSPLFLHTAEPLLHENILAI